MIIAKPMPNISKPVFVGVLAVVVVFSVIGGYELGHSQGYNLGYSNGTQAGTEQVLFQQGSTFNLSPGSNVSVTLPSFSAQKDVNITYFFSIIPTSHNKGSVNMEILEGNNVVYHTGYQSNRDSGSFSLKNTGNGTLTVMFIADSSNSGHVVVTMDSPVDLHLS